MLYCFVVLAWKQVHFPAQQHLEQQQQKPPKKFKITNTNPGTANDTSVFER